MARSGVFENVRRIRAQFPAVIGPAWSIFQPAQAAIGPNRRKSLAGRL